MQGEFALLSEAQAWEAMATGEIPEAMATGEIPETKNGSAPSNGAASPGEEASQWIAAWRSKQPATIVDAGVWPANA